MKRTFGKLREKIREVFGTQEKCAIAWGKDKSTLNLKLNGKIEWSLTDIEELCQLLGISMDEVKDYFFYN